jgi:ABC-type polysaccharide/polyol phosphate transport system ATPase subunit
VAPQFIYVMKALRKVIPPSRIILDDIWLSFYPGAKIGVLGPNGAGKSTRGPTKARASAFSRKSPCSIRKKM